MAARALEAALQAPPEASATYTISWVEAPSIVQDETRNAVQARRNGVFMGKSMQEGTETRSGSTAESAR